MQTLKVGESNTCTQNHKLGQVVKMTSFISPGGSNVLTEGEYVYLTMYECWHCVHWNRKQHRLMCTKQLFLQLDHKFIN